MRLLAAAFALCLVGGNACARDLTKSAISGQLTKMGVYSSWTTECQSKLGVVKVVSKPSHGTLTPTQVTTNIGTSRYNPERTAKCKGLPTSGFRVDYISDPGFRGTDQFVVEFTYGHGPDTDHYTVEVR
jgi:hypothetical protein